MAAPFNVAELQQVIEQLNARIEHLEQRPVLQQQRPRRCLPDPDRFSGQIRYDTWRLLARAVLRIDGDALGGVEA